MNPFGIFNKLNEDTCLVVDIGNASVGASFVSFVKSKKPEILTTERLPLDFSNKPDSKDLSSKTITMLNEVIGRLIKSFFQKNENKYQRIEKVLVTISSPWFFSKNKDVKINNSKDFFITRSFLDDVLMKEIDDFEKSILNENKENLTVIEKTITKTGIRGYTVSDPLGKKTNSLDLSIYISVSEKSFIDNIKNTIVKHLSVKMNDIIFHSFPISCFGAIDSIFKGEENYLHFDITGEITDITMVKNGSIEGQASFPCGKNYFIRFVAKKLDLPQDIAFSFIKLYQEKKLNGDMDKKIEDTLVEIETEWNVYLEESLSSLKNDFDLPKKLFLTVDDDVLKIFQYMLKNGKSSKTMLWKNNLIIINLNKDILKDFIVNKNQNYFDNFLALNSIFLSKFQ